MRSSADPGLQQEGWEAGGVNSSGKQALRDAKESPSFCLEAVLGDHLSRGGGQAVRIRLRASADLLGLVLIRVFFPL